MKISLTSISSLFLCQHCTAGEAVSAPIRLVTVVGDQVRASQIIKTLMLSAIDCYRAVFPGLQAAHTLFHQGQCHFQRAYVFLWQKPSSVVVS